MISILLKHAEPKRPLHHPGPPRNEAIFYIFLHHSFSDVFMNSVSKMEQKYLKFEEKVVRNRSRNTSWSEKCDFSKNAIPPMRFSWFSRFRGTKNQQKSIRIVEKYVSKRIQHKKRFQIMILLHFSSILGQKRPHFETL